MALGPNSAAGYLERILRQVYAEHKQLGDAGTSMKITNHLDRAVLLADYEAEGIIIEQLRRVAEAESIAFRFYSAHRGSDFIGEDGFPLYTVTMDGLSGSAVYATSKPRAREFPHVMPDQFDTVPRYGTMISIAQGMNPTYADVIAAAILEPMTHRMLVAARGSCTILHHLYADNEDEIAYVSGHRQLSPRGIVYCDITSQRNFARFGRPLLRAGFPTAMAGSTARYYLDVATGHAVACCEWTRLGNLGAMVGYLLVTSTGGVVVDLVGNDIGTRYYHSWGQSEFTNFFVAACHRDVAEQILSIVRA